MVLQFGCATFYVLPFNDFRGLGAKHQPFQLLLRANPQTKNSDRCTTDGAQR